MMDIHYRSDTAQMTHAALLYVQYHLSSGYWTLISSIVGIGTFISLPIYWKSNNLDAYLILLHLLVVLFVFGRYRLYRRMIQKNMQRHPMHNKEVHITFTEECITYTGDSTALEDGSATWEKVSLVLETANGYIFIVPRGHFVWVPFAEFPSTQTLSTIQAFLSKKGLRIEVHPEWSC